MICLSKRWEDGNVQDQQGGKYANQEFNFGDVKFWKPTTYPDGDVSQAVDYVRFEFSRGPWKMSLSRKKGQLEKRYDLTPVESTDIEKVRKKEKKKT